MTNEETIFAAALGKSPGAERGAYLDQACADNADLRREVEALLFAHERAGGILETSPHGLNVTGEVRPAESVGATVGPYKLLQQIGEGGMAVVFLAEQSRPIQRKVALKIIKPGMDSRQVIARFEAERQALAVMDHGNIAKVLEAGTTESGHPYFVMELVKGVPITRYCDEHHLSPRQRLELFVQVCSAVQHAHTKGIIHRDLKPSNVLVALYDGKAVPKVIDFGIAKATGQALTERTLFTTFGSVVGTPEYMSPEQAELNQLDVDTRSDIYSLGVLLYELLTGSTPVEHSRFKSAALLEMLRVVREEEPPRPSTRLSTSGGLPSIAANRGLEPKKLSALVHGELDWIVMKALEKDRGRRYETANGFAMDVKRYLDDEAVQACPPSGLYRFRKFARRHTVALAISGLVVFFLVLLGSGIGWAVRDRTARQAKVSGQLELILDEVARFEQAEKWPEALASARRAEPALAAGEAGSDIQERVRQAIADLELVRRLDEIRAQSGTAWGPGDPGHIRFAARANREYEATLREARIDLDALSINEAAKRITARGQIAAALLPALDDWVAVRSVGNDEAATRRLSDLLKAADPDPWRQQVRDALVRKDWPALENLARSPALERQSAATLSFLCAVLRANQKFLLEMVVLRRAQWKYPADYWINHRLGIALIWLGKEHAEEGMGYMRAAVATRPESAHAVSNLGNGYSALGDYDQAIVCFQRAIEILPNYPGCYSNLALAFHRKGLYEEAIAAFEQSIKLSPARGTEKYAELSMIHSNCPDARFRNPRRATELAEKAVEIEPQAGNNWTALGIARYREGRWQEARTAFDKSLQLGTGNLGGALPLADAIDWFFLAMSNWQLGQQDQARQCYDRAMQGTEQGQTWQTDVQQLRRYRAEAEGLLKIIAPIPTTKPQSK